MALTLRTLGGLQTPEIARAFLTLGAGDAAAPRACEAQDPRRPHPVRRAAGPRAARPARARCSPRSISSSTRATPRRRDESLVRRELCAEAIRLARVLRGAHAGRARGGRAARADAAARLAARRAHGPGRRAGAARGPGPLALGPRGDRGGARARRAGCLPGTYALQAAIAAEHARAATPAETDWASDRRAVRPARPSGARPGRRAEPGGGRCAWPRAKSAASS